MYMHDPAQLLLLHSTTHGDLIAEAEAARQHRARRRARMRQVTRRMYYRSVRRVRVIRAATALPSRVTP